MLAILALVANVLLSPNAKTIGAIAGAGLAGLAVGAVAGTLIGKSISSNGSSTSRKRRVTSTKRKRRSGRYTPHTAGKGKDRSTKRIRYTKNGQPYVLMKSGKARFIKKSGARRSHRTKGGRY